MDMNYFDAEKTRDNLVAWIRNWFDKNGKDKRKERANRRKNCLRLDESRPYKNVLQ